MAIEAQNWRKEEEGKVARGRPHVETRPETGRTDLLGSNNLLRPHRESHRKSWDDEEEVPWGDRRVPPASEGGGVAKI